jgi:uncharacterized protein (DUF1786 family)
VSIDTQCQRSSRPDEMTEGVVLPSVDRSSEHHRIRVRFSISAQRVRGLSREGRTSITFSGLILGGN